MPWLGDEIPDWNELSEEEQEALREIIRELGMNFPVEDDNEYFE